MMDALFWAVMGAMATLAALTGYALWIGYTGILRGDADRCHRRGPR
jgi:hypothetical protein